MPSISATPSRRSLGASLGALALLFSGCHSAMTTASSQNAPGERADAGDSVAGTVADWPLTFQHHQFGAACFDTQQCRIDYGDFEFGSPAATGPATALTPQAYDAAMTASYGPVARNAPPAEVAWRCKDGSELRAEVDIAAIFADGAIRHEVPRDEIAEGVSMGTTHVVIEVNNRTVSVYTRTMIPTKHEQIPGNRFSAFRNDLIKVYSRAY